MTQHHLFTMVTTMLLLAAGVGAVAAEVAKPQVADRPGRAADKDRIAALVEQLDSNRYREREQATQALLEAGSAALDPLVAAANSDRPEPADRAVWVLKKMGGSADRDLALAALDRLVQVKNRPAVVTEARQIQSRLRLAACQEQLAKLGGQLSVADFVLLDVGPIHVVRVELGDDWRGTVDDLRCLLALDQHHYFRLVGAAVDNEVVRLFESKEGLRLLQIFTSRVTPAAADSLKEHQPKAVVYIRNRALLGIQGDSQANGVRVIQAQPDYGAAQAGIVAGDVVTTIDGKPIKDFDRLTALIAQHQPGDEVEVVILRGDRTLTKRVTLSDQPPEP
jgi:membrane-associated protease RseP (regulator of RpoE activity)